MRTIKRQPLLGIFWSFKGRLLRAQTRLEDGIDAPDAINAKDDHVTFWPVLQRGHPDLRNLEYEDVPRGRVVFMKKPKKFLVYMDKKLHKPTVKKLIMAEFHLPETTTVFRTDSHYTTDPDELKRLFAEE
jgi:hypothetical protein